MAHVDKELVNVFKLFKTEKPAYYSILKQFHCRFNLKYESMLSVLNKVDYKACIKYILQYADEIDKVPIELEDENGMQKYILPSCFSSINGLFDITNKIKINLSFVKGEGHILSFCIENIRMKDLPKYFFMASVIGNALAYKYETDPFIVDFFCRSLEMDKESYKMYKDVDLGKCRYELPQFTINEDCKGKDVKDMKVDDFEIL